MKFLLLLTLLLPTPAQAYIGPAIAGLLGSAVGAVGMVAISVGFVIAWPVIKFVMKRRQKKAEAAENDNKQP